MNNITLSPIGTVHSPYKEKFAIPRQPGLVSAAQGEILLYDKANNEEIVRGLAQFSHIWVLFIFHQTAKQGWKPLVRPPRLGGNKKIGALATRSTFRPNPVGMSAIKLESIETSNQQVKLIVSGLDLLDNTPVIDIKPYIPYSDSIASASAGYAQSEPELLEVSFSNKANKSTKQLENSYPKLTLLIQQVLAQDPRPAYKAKQIDDKIYGITLYNLNIKWRLISASKIEVIEICSAT